MKLSTNELKILKIMKENSEGLTRSDLCEKSNLSSPTIIKSLRVLYGMRKIKIREISQTKLYLFIED